MAQDNTTKIVIGIIILIAVIGVFLLFKSGAYKYPGRESPGRYGDECCTCTRAEENLDGAVKPDTREVLFHNVMVDDCASACAETHMYTKKPHVKYDVNAFVSDDSACKLDLAEPRAYQGAGGPGGFADQPMQDQYYVS